MEPEKPENTWQLKGFKGDYPTLEALITAVTDAGVDPDEIVYLNGHPIETLFELMQI